MFIMLTKYDRMNMIHPVTSRQGPVPEVMVYDRPDVVDLYVVLWQLQIYLFKISFH